MESNDIEREKFQEESNREDSKDFENWRQMRSENCSKYSSSNTLNSSDCSLPLNESLKFGAVSEEDDILQSEFSPAVNYEFTKIYPTGETNLDQNMLDPSEKHQLTCKKTKKVKANLRKKKKYEWKMKTSATIRHSERNKHNTQSVTPDTILESIPFSYKQDFKQTSKYSHFSQFTTKNSIDRNLQSHQIGETNLITEDTYANIASGTLDNFNYLKETKSNDKSDCIILDPFEIENFGTRAEEEIFASSNFDIPKTHMGLSLDSDSGSDSDSKCKSLYRYSSITSKLQLPLVKSNNIPVVNNICNSESTAFKKMSDVSLEQCQVQDIENERKSLYNNNISNSFNTSISNSTFATTTSVSTSSAVENFKYPFHCNFKQYKLFDDKVNEQKFSKNNVNTREHLERKEIIDLSTTSLLKNSLHMPNKDIIQKLDDHPPVLKTFKSSDVIMHYRQELDEIAEENIKKILLEREKVFLAMQNSKESSKRILQNRLNNLHLQQNQFDGVVEHAKNQFAYHQSSGYDDVIKSCEKIKTVVRNESRLFENFFPAYAFRGNVLEHLANNQLLIIKAENCYCFNIVLPLILKKQFPHHFVISCEKSDVQKQCLSHALSMTLKKRNEKCYNQVQFTTEYFIMTEQEMLNYSTKRENFIKKSTCIIFNFSFSRTVACDILLSNFRDMLVENKTSKLVMILSSCMDVTNLQKYFEQLNPIKLYSESLTFPIKSIWKSNSLTPEINYVEETAKTIMAIHTLEDFGNILVFMPSLKDARSVSKLLKKYCSEYKRNDMYNVLLEDNCFDLSDLNLLTTTSCSQRIIFFSTGSAETLNIPSACFVIDCGVQEDYIYDGKKNINVLNTIFISSIRVKHRKSLAGGYNPGISYRIYNRLNYIEDMPERDYPEMLYGSPLNTLIKIIKYKPDLATKSQFIESLPKDVADNTLNILQKFGAIVNNTVSKIGEDIIKLPFEAKYSKLILLGVDFGLAYETIIIASFFAVKGRLFKHSDIPKHQRVIDAMQINLIKNKSDTLTCINVYKTCAQNNFDFNWCKKYYINLDFLRSIQQKVDEMCEIIYSCLEIKVNKQFSTFEDWCSVLSELLFICFQDNLCVFTGRLECGFRILSSNAIGFLHPLSVALQEDNVPQFVIFDHLITVDKIYLKNVTAISSDLTMKALQNSSLNFNCDKLFETLINRTIEPVGEEVMNHVFFGEDGEKLDKIIEMIKLKTGSDLISVVPSIKNGCVYIYALPEYIDIAYTALQNIMRVKFEEIINECKLNLFELTKDQNLVFLEVNWSKGAQTTSVKVKPNHQIPNFNDENSGLGNASFQAKMFARFPYSLHITWLRRPCNGDALVDFTNKTDLRLIRKLSLRHICLLRAETFMQMSQEKKNQLCISGLPPTTNKIELRKELESLLPDAEIDSVELMHISPFETSDKRLESIKSTIVDICKNVINLDSSEIQIKKPKPKDLYMEIFIKANGCEGLDSVSDIITAKLTEENKIITDTEFTVQVIWDADLCRALQPRLASTLMELQNDLKSQSNLKDWFHSFIDKQNEFYTINVCSSNLDVLKLAHKSINGLRDGDVLSNKNVEGINKLFCHGGHVWLRGLEKDENIYILEDHTRKIIRLYGSHSSCEQAKVRISKFLEDAENDVMEMIPLSNEKTKNKLLKAVIETYGINLKSLIELCGMQSALLDIRASVLLLRGNRESIDKAIECIEELFESLDAVDSSEVLSQEICPVCGCPATNLTFRLEHCGHLYCQPCIQGLIEADNFPIQCIAEGCNKEVVLKDVNKILNENPERINKLLEKSIRNYIERNVTNIMYCPATDCNMFFLKNELNKNKILCPLCQNNICISCNSIYHDGLTCEFYQETRKDPDYGFKIWQTTANCKQCPRCKMAIEKTQGCNHMTCKNCNGHFCWLCPSETAEIYATGQEVYTHINQHHTNRLFE